MTSLYFRKMHDYEVISRVLDYWKPQVGGFSDWISGLNVYDEFHSFIPECQSVLNGSSEKRMKQYLDYIQYEAMGNSVSKEREQKTQSVANSFITIWENHSKPKCNIRVYTETLSLDYHNGRQYIQQTPLDIMKLIIESYDFNNHLQGWLAGQDSLNEFDEIISKMVIYYYQKIPLRDYFDKIDALFRKTSKSESWDDCFKKLFGFLVRERSGPPIVTDFDPKLRKHKLETLYINKDGGIFNRNNDF